MKKLCPFRKRVTYRNDLFDISFDSIEFINSSEAKCMDEEFMECIGVTCMAFKYSSSPSGNNICLRLGEKQ